MGIENHIGTPLAAAVRAAGSQSAFGRLIGKGQATINDWLRLGKALPAEHVLAVEAATGVSRYALRPDIYPPEELPSRPIIGDATGPVACDRRADLHPASIGEPAR